MADCGGVSQRLSTSRQWRIWEVVDYSVSSFDSVLHIPTANTEAAARPEQQKCSRIAQFLLDTPFRWVECVSRNCESGWSACETFLACRRVQQRRRRHQKTRHDDPTSDCETRQNTFLYIPESLSRAHRNFLVRRPLGHSSWALLWKHGLFFKRQGWTPPQEFEWTSHVSRWRAKGHMSVTAQWWSSDIPVSRWLLQLVRPGGDCIEKRTCVHILE